MNPQNILDYVSRFLLTQNAKCLSPQGTCWCQQGTLRCAAASMAIESNVTRWTAPHEIPSLGFIYGTDTRYLIVDLINVHDKRAVDCWEQELAIVALKHGLKPFSQRDLQGRRGSKTRWPYGIQIKNGGKGFKKFTPQQARTICLRTISNNSQLTLEEFAKIYCPPNHKRWAVMVHNIYNK